ncbi:MAG: peptidase S8, partial [Candidatus Aminicenantes bacterium]
MKTKKIFFLFFIIYIFIFLASFQHHRLDRYKKPLYRFFRPRIQSINKGLPFQLKEKQYVPDQILIKFKPTLSELLIETTLAAYQTKKINRIPRLNIYQLQIPRDLTVEE